MTRSMELDEELVQAVTQGSEAGSAKAAVESILRNHVQSRKLETLRSLRGTVEFWQDYDYKSMRADGDEPVANL